MRFRVYSKICDVISDIIGAKWLQDGLTGHGRRVGRNEEDADDDDAEERVGQHVVRRVDHHGHHAEPRETAHAVTRLVADNSDKHFLCTF